MKMQLSLVSEALSASARKPLPNTPDHFWCGVEKAIIGSRFARKLLTNTHIKVDDYLLSSYEDRLMGRPCFHCLMSELWDVDLKSDFLDVLNELSASAGNATTFRSRDVYSLKGARPVARYCYRRLLLTTLKPSYL